MKKSVIIITMFIVTFLSTSCSGDDSTPINITPQAEELTLKYNGVYKIFENVRISGVIWRDGVHTRDITAHEKGNPSNKISFRFIESPLDENRGVESVIYSENDEEVFSCLMATATILMYNPNLLRGSFQATDGENKIREAKFNIYY